MDTATGEKYFTAVAYILKPRFTAYRSYSTDGFDISKGGTYRLIVPFFIHEGNGHKKYYTWIEFEVVAFPSFSDLKEKYPHFYGLNTDGGLTVYIWQLSELHYGCYLVSTSMDTLTDTSFTFENGASIQEMLTIISSYSIGKENVTIKPVRNPISSYYYEINDEYRQSLEEYFWSVNPYYNRLIDNAYIDIDNDGTTELCTMQYGLTSGVFSFIFNAWEIETNEIKYHTVFYSQWYDLSFQKGSDGITRVQGITQGDDPVTHLFDISVVDGEVNLTENGVHIGFIS